MLRALPGPAGSCAQGTRRSPPTMLPMSRQPPDLRPGRPERPAGAGPRPPDPAWRWVVIVVVCLLAATVILPSLLGGGGTTHLAYDQFTKLAAQNQVATADIDTTNGHITGKLVDKSSYSVTGPNPASPLASTDQSKLAADHVQVSYHTPSSNALLNWLPLILLLALMVGFYLWM